MQAIFYTFTKRINSTARPASGGTSYDIILKEDSGLLQPEIFLKWTGSGSPCAFNYVHIPDFQRYYWVSNWTYSERQWGASLSVDVLASWRTQIGAAQKYVLRSYAESDPLVLDKIYPAKAEAVWSAASTPASELGINITTGCYVVGVTGGSTGGSVGGTLYYICTNGMLAKMLSTVFSDPGQYAQQLSAAANVEDVLRIIGEMEYRGVANIPDFITSIMWIPFNIATIAPGASEDIYLGYLKAGQGIRPQSTVFSLSTNIDYSSFTFGNPRWPYVEPYAEYQLYWPPVGSVPLDGASLASSVSKRLALDFYFDIISGICRLVYKYTGLTPAGEASAMLGVPIAMHGQWYDYGSMLSALTGAVRGAASLAAGIPDPGALSAVGDMISATSPQAYGSGRSGGRGGISELLYITCCRRPHVPEDLIENGRPLCAVRRISALSGGYVLCREGDIEAPCTDGELDQISQYLTGGFFYE